MATKEQLTWNTLDTDDFPATFKTAREAWQAQQNKANELRTKMESILKPLVAPMVPVGMTPKFAYKWGKVSIAFAGKSTTTKSSKALSYADIQALVKARTEK